MQAEDELCKLVEFFHLVEKLKHEKRRGWLDRGVQNCESVADHSLRLALMALVFAQRQKLDVCKAMKMAVVHDLPEAICGDVATRIKEELQQTPNKEKHEREGKALQQLLALLPKEIAAEVKSLFEEFEERKSREALLLFELDRLEAIFQAREYEAKGNFKVSLQEFYDYADTRLKNPELRKAFGLLMKEKEM